MSASPTQMLFAHIGVAPLEECVDVPEPAVCWICAGVTRRAAPRADWPNANYTGQNKVKAPSSPWICEACVYLHKRFAPVPGRPPAEGKTLGGNFRNYSHLFEQAPDGTIYVNASKGEKPVILAFLRAEKAGLWWAAIADSGQKHVLPWAPINGAGVRGRALFDETVVELPDAAGFCLVNEIAALLTAGATKDEIGSGSYQRGAWTRCAAKIRAFEARWGRGRHGAWFGLALWLAQRDEAAVAVRQAEEQRTRTAKTRGSGGKRGDRRDDEREAEDADGRGAARGAGGVPRERGQPAHALGAAAGPNAQRGATGADSGGVGDAPGAGASAPGAVQFGLPGAG